MVDCGNIVKLTFETCLRFNVTDFKGKYLFCKNMVMRLDVKKEACMVYLLR